MRDWLAALRRYLGVTVFGHLTWEILHVPLYTIWTEGTPQEITFAVAHCTGGDLLIAVAVLVAALVLRGTASWPAERFVDVTVLTVLFGVAYTVFSEWLNVSVRYAWAYTESMPTLPPFGTGLTPVLQWLVVPLLALCAARGLGRTQSTPS